MKQHIVTGSQKMIEGKNHSQLQQPLNDFKVSPLKICIHDSEKLERICTCTTISNFNNNKTHCFFLMS